MNQIAGLLRRAILSHLADIVIDKGLGAPELYNVYVKENADNIIIKIEGSISEFGIHNPLRRYIVDRIGFDEWNANISQVFDRLLKDAGIKIDYLLTTKIDPVNFEVILKITES